MITSGEIQKSRAPPKMTAEDAVKLKPTMVTLVPPEVDAWEGEKELIAGGAT